MMHSKVESLSVADGMPRGFKMKVSGIFRETEDKDGNRDEAFLCSPLRVMALTRNEASEDWGRLVEITDADGRAKRWAIPAALLAGDGLEIRQNLLRLGLDIASGPKSRAALHDLLTQWRPKRRATSVNRLGWTAAGDAFVLGGGRVLGDDSVVHQAEAVGGAAAEIRGHGTLAEWRDSVGAACEGNPLLAFAVSTAFAGALLDPLGIEGGGVHFPGASSVGKTTLARAAASVWGSPQFMMTWRATANGLEGTAAACNSTLLVLDEMGQVDAREAGAVAYMLANGQGKQRADRTGAARRAATWRLMFISTGELGLASKMAEKGQRVRAGQEVRLLEIPADNRAHGVFARIDGNSAAAFADSIKAASASAFGTAGPAFVEALLAEGARDEVRAFVKCFEAVAHHRYPGADGQVSRAITRFAVIAAAGEFATEKGVTGWQPMAAQAAALDALEQWVERRGGCGSAEDREAIDRVAAFIERYGPSRFHEMCNGKPMERDQPRDRAGYREGNLYWISTAIWRDEIFAGTDPTRAAQSLDFRGMLVPGDGRNLQQRLPRGVPGRPRAYCIDLEKLVGPIGPIGPC